MPAAEIAATIDEFRTNHLSELREVLTATSVMLNFSLLELSWNSMKLFVGIGP